MTRSPLDSSWTWRFFFIPYDTDPFVNINCYTQTPRDFRKVKRESRNFSPSKALVFFIMVPFGNDVAIYHSRMHNDDELHFYTVVRECNENTESNDTEMPLAYPLTSCAR